ncbi:DUF1565 domain-containing protein [Microcoleus sp. FACHB-1515]|uniref:DUF1565 domain-containing protein n=1 Tax=Cyanophyceae TaxID=3028117 RepID=UPI0016882FE3|nr:DUF1565 domain-containing protein [Microcoleus sp. FACHB-1515]MBD2088382.1 DUF1565 domain-containing protein [Microcoleus sp. FACHB-1515]
MVQSAAIYYVNPQTGNDGSAGGQGSPFRSLTRALRQAGVGGTVRLSAGTYSSATGEVFPIVVPAGVSVIGDEASKGSAIVISGSGVFASPTFGQQNVAVRLESNAQLRGVTVSNRAERGTGVWLESTAPTIANCTFTGCGREGIFATGAANPDIRDCVFSQNAASGMSIARNAKGEIRRNTFQRTGYGIAINDNAAPLVADNRATDNRAGIVIANLARPVLRNNVLTGNGEGLVLLNTALPDIGQTQDPGGNVFANNQTIDLRNSTSAAIVSVGNQVNPTRISGNVTLGVSLVTAPAPMPAPTPAPTPTPTPTPIVPGQFPDISGHWAASFINGLVSRNILSGFPDGTFQPERNITRAQYAAAIAQTYNLSAQRPDIRFVDIPPNFWAANAIAKAQQMGFIAGFPDGTFRPSLNLTRIQAIVSIVNGLALTGGTPNLLSVYRDRAEIPSYATTAVAAATAQRLIVNFPQVDRLRPLVDITRAEVAAILYQSLVAAKQAPAVSSPYIVSA